MGYFSELDLELQEKDEGFTWKDYLYMRLEFLRAREEDLEEMGASFKGEFTYIEDDIKYILPEHISDFETLYKTIDLVKSELWTEYGEDPETIISIEDVIDNQPEDEDIEGQISFYDYGMVA